MILLLLLLFCAAVPLAGGLARCIVHAFPLLIGWWVAVALWRSGAGWLAAPLLGFVAAMLVMAAGTLATRLGSTPLASVVRLLFAAPAAVAGYAAVHGLAGATGAAPLWQSLFAASAALAAAGASLATLGPTPPGGARRE